MEFEESVVDVPYGVKFVNDENFPNLRSEGRSDLIDQSSCEEKEEHTRVAKLSLSQSL